MSNRLATVPDRPRAGARCSSLITVRSGCQGVPGRHTRATGPLSAAAILLAAGLARGQCLQQWSGDIGIPPGMDGTINCLTTFDLDQSGPLPPVLVAAGAFGTSGGTATARIAYWDGVKWRSFGPGLSTNSFATVLAMTTWDPDGPGPQAPQLIVGGNFTTATNAVCIARWDTVTQTWQPLGTGTNNIVRALTVWDPDGDGPIPPQLIAGGDFTTAGGITVNRIARWDGAAWQPLAAGANAPIAALTTWDPDGPGGPLPEVLVAGGSFTSIGGVSASRIARFDGTSWQAFGTGVNSTVWSLGKWDGGTGPQLTASGDFTVAGGVTVNRLARYDGAAWQPFGTGFDGTVYNFIAWDPDGSGAMPQQLVASGAFTTAGGAAIPRIAHWNGTAWQPFGTGVNGAAVYGLSLWDPDGAGPAEPQLFVGGDFTLAAGNIANRVAAWVSAPAPVVLTSPSPVTACPGSQTVFSVRAAAGAFPTYRWRRNGTPLSDGPTGTGSSILGSASISLTISNTSGADAGQYDVVVTNSCGNAQSAAAALSFCFANCDCSTTPPALNVNDFVCFQTRFAQGSTLANCDGSTSAPILNVNDFICFQTKYAAGCP